MNSTCQKRGYFWAFTKFLLFANCWSANKFWSASIVAGVFSLRNCGWLVERFFFCYPEDVLGEQYVTSSWTSVMSWQFRFCSVAPVTMSRWHRLSLWSPVTMSSWHRLSLWTPVTMSRWHRLSLSLSLNSCHHVTAFLWARALCHVTVEEARFRMRITMGVVLIRSLVCTKCAPGGLRNGSGVAV